MPGPESKYFTKISDFNKKTKFSEKLGLDERDNVILSMIQKQPDVSQDDIAKKVKLSQPSVGARIKRLRDKGIVHIINGVNFKVIDLYLAKVDVNTIDTSAVIAEFAECPFFINALVTSGKYNLVLFFTATDMKRMENIVNRHLRNNPKVKDIEMNIVISTAKDLVLPVNLECGEDSQICEKKCSD